MRAPARPLCAVRAALRRVRRYRRTRKPVRRDYGPQRDPRLDPAERVLPQDVQVAAEDAVNASFGLPPSWRCPCGGRPFETERTCPRCGRGIEERWA